MSHSAPLHPELPVRIGDFAIVGVLGEGGSGIVYDARWGHREVALKVLHPALVATVKEREQFFAEARRLAEIHHPGVVKVLAVGETPDARPYLAMEKLAGESLACRLGRGPVPVAHALELFGQLSDAVDAMHGRGLVHRDLKPENVVLVVGVDGREHAVLLDFGIAKEVGAAASTTTQDGGVRGTPAYMAPERFFGQPASVATDVYELAVMLFAMLAGRLPWEDSAAPEDRLDPRRLADLAPHVSSALDIEVRRALSTRAQIRPASAGELRGAVMAAAGMAWSARTTVDVTRGDGSCGPDQALVDRAPDSFVEGPARARWGSAPPPYVQQAPTGSTASTPRRNKRIAVATVLGVVAIGGIGVAAALLSGSGTAAEEQQRQAAAAAGTGAPGIAPPPGGPTAPAGTPPTETPPASAHGLMAPSPSVPPPVDIELRRAGLLAAVAHLPDDELFAFGVQVAQLDADSDLRGLIDMIADSPTGLVMRAQAEINACGVDMRGRTDWLIAGGPDDRAAIDVIASGRWTRAELEDCLKVAVGAERIEAAGDRISLLRSPSGDRAVAWLDDHTFLISSRADADAAWMTARLDDRTPPVGTLGSMLPEVALGSTAWFAGDGVGDRVGLMDKDSGMAALWGSLDARQSEAVIDLRIRYPSAKEAKAAQADLAGQAKQLGVDEIIGRFSIELDDQRPDVLHADIAMSRLIVGMLMQAVQTGALTQ